jgi:hypothetical protein
LDHGETDEGCDGSAIAFVIASKAAASADPRQRAFDNPSFWQHLEAGDAVEALDDFDDPRADACRGLGRLRALVASVSENAFDKGKEAADAFVEQERNAVAILDVGGMDDDIQ